MKKIFMLLQKIPSFCPHHKKCFLAFSYISCISAIPGIQYFHIACFGQVRNRKGVFMKELDYVGHPLQLSGVEQYRLQGGKGDGMRLLRVRNGKGTDLTISPDRCFDISELYFDGVRMNYTSPSGYVSPFYYNEGRDGFGFLKSFNCGMFTTCGLKNIGVPNEEDGVFYGLHGNIDNTPAENFSYDETDSSIIATARMRDAVIFGSKLILERTITLSKKDNLLEIRDKIKNEGTVKEAVMLLYHINIGYPLLSENASLTINSDQVIPRDDRAAEDLKTWNKMLKPVPNFQEQCYYHTFSKKKAVAAVTNPAIQKGLEISFSPSEFPQMTEWKMMGVHDYVLGLEPCTNTLEGRKTVHASGKIKEIKPGAYAEYGFQIRLFRTEK